MEKPGTKGTKNKAVFLYFVGHICGRAKEGGHVLRQDGALNVTETVENTSDVNRVTPANPIKN